MGNKSTAAKMNTTDNIAARLKEAISENGGYEKISAQTGISKSTLVRMASGKTDPKLKDVMDIAEATKSSLNYIAYGIKGDTMEEQVASAIAKAITGLSQKLAKEEKAKSEEK